MPEIRASQRFQRIFLLTSLDVIDDLVVAVPLDALGGPKWSGAKHGCQPGLSFSNALAISAALAWRLRRKEICPELTSTHPSLHPFDAAFTSTHPERG